MEKSVYTIKMNFKSAMDQADQLEEVANEIERTAKTDIMGSMNRIVKSWTGEASRDYCKKGQKVAENILKYAKQLKESAEAIREIAQRTYRAEMKALELAKKREY